MTETQGRVNAQKERFSWGPFNWWQVVVIHRVSNIIAVLAVIGLVLSVLFFNRINTDYIVVLLLITSGAGALGGPLSLSHWHIRLRDYI